MLFVKILFGVIGFACLIVGFKYNKELHKDAFFQSTNPQDSGEEILFGYLIDFVFNIMPWWAMKIFWVLVGIVFIVVDLLLIFDV